MVSATATRSRRAPCRRTGTRRSTCTSVTRDQDHRRLAAADAEAARLHLRQARLIDTKGLPICTPAKLAETTAPVARKRCAGRDRRRRDRQGGRQPPRPGRRSTISSPLTFFNAPPQGGKPSLIAHAYETSRSPKTLLVPFAVERISQGRYGFRVEIQLPEIAEGYGAATLAEATIGQDLEARRQDGRLRQRLLRRRPPPGLRHALLRRRQPLPRHPDLAMPRRRAEQGGVALCCALAALAAASAAGGARWSKSTTSSSAPTAASSRAPCRATSSPRSTSRATSTSPPKAAARRSALNQVGDRLRPRRPPQPPAACRSARRNEWRTPAPAEARQACRGRDRRHAAASKRWSHSPAARSRPARR